LNLILILELSSEYKRNCITISHSVLPSTGIPSLSASESTSIEFNRIFNQKMPIASADIEVFVSYKPFLVPFRLSKSQRFKTMLNYSGELVWIPAAGSSMK
jgi:hypothetical protein